MEGQNPGRLPSASVEQRIAALRALADFLVAEVARLEGAAGQYSIPDVERGVSFFDEVARYETYLIKRALEAAEGNQARAARLLGLNETTISSKIRRLGIRIAKSQTGAAGSTRASALPSDAQPARSPEGRESAGGARGGSTPDVARVICQGRSPRGQQGGGGSPADPAGAGGE
ncbi:MAG TPA: helix-turn-helix domain-containing protein [Pyrinomonadaceae bacterium]